MSEAYMDFQFEQKKDTASEVLKVLKAEKSVWGAELTASLEAMMAFKDEHEGLSLQTTSGSNMIMDGVASYNHGYDSLDIRISFLDTTGAVLQREFIYSSGYRTGGKRRSGIDFQKTFPVPAGSAAITFSSFAQDRSGHR